MKLGIAPSAALRFVDRVLSKAPTLTWRWRFSIYCEALRREAEVEEEPLLPALVERLGC